MENQKFYVGPRGVDHVVIDEMKTFSGAEVVVVHYDGGYQELMSKKTYELVSSQEPSDFTMVRNKKVAAITKELFPLIAEYIASLKGTVGEVKISKTNFLQKALAVITEYDIKISEIDNLINPINAEIQGTINALGSEIDNVFNRAINYCWIKDDTQFIPGANPMLERTLLEATKINNTIPVVATEQPKQDEPENK